MQFNTIQPGVGAKTARRRVGRGMGSGAGKTSGRGHKGQKARSGGFHKVGFEGGQMPLQRRLPKFGFSSRKSLFVAEVRLHELALLKDNEVTLDSLKAVGLIGRHVLRARIIAKGEINGALTVRGVHVTRGAKAAIEAQGGKISD